MYFYRSRLKIEKNFELTILNKQRIDDCNN